MKLVKILFAVIVLLVVTSVTYSNHSLDDSQRVSDLTQELAVLEKNNTILRSEIAAAGSLTKISERVEAMGFVATPAIVTVTVPGAVALR